MDVASDPSFAEDAPEPRPVPMQPSSLREKTKRPQLSCNPCRTRKVKCDRIQPCTACSLHQIANHCHYDLSESERQPILQAEALKEKDRSILRLRNEIQLLRGQPIKPEPLDDDQAGRIRPRMRLPPKIPKRPTAVGHKRYYEGAFDDNIYFGTPGMTSVVQEFASLSVQGPIPSLTHAVPRGRDIFSHQMKTAFPFPTVWPATDETSCLLGVLPSQDDIFVYLESFQRRAQSCTFPHMPEECTHTEIQRFLENIDQHAVTNPDMFALLFATMAQGLQCGIYDRCGERWIAGAVDAESQRGDVFVAAAMQALRMGSFLSRPTLLTIQTLLLIGPYLTNSGKFLDAWAVFGLSIRLAQNLGLHRDPNRLNPPAPAEQIMVRKNLWWWMLHLDQHYSITLGRPLGISSIGDCPTPEPLIVDPVIQSLSNYVSQYTLLARQILSAGFLDNAQIDKFTDQLVYLRATLPEAIQFDQTWLNQEKPLPPWPLDAQAVGFHAKTHNMILLLNRQRIEDPLEARTSEPYLKREGQSNPAARGRERVLQSCRAVLHAFEFFHIRVRAAMICWTMAQQAFNAAMILVLSMFETKDPQDLHIVQLAMSTFHEMSRLGVHKLAGPALEKLSTLMREFQAGESAKEKVMGNNGMFLLEDPGLQGFKEDFLPLHFEMAGSAMPQDRPSKRRSVAGEHSDLSSSSASKQPTASHPKKKGQNKPVSTRGIKSRAPPNKSMSRSQKPPNLRRLSELSPQIRREQIRSANNADIPLLIPDSLSAPTTALPNDDQLYSPFSTDPHSAGHISELAFNTSIPRSGTFPQDRSFFHQPSTSGTDPNIPIFTSGGHIVPSTSAEAYQAQPGQHQTFPFDLDDISFTQYQQGPASYLASPYDSVPQTSASYQHHF